MNHPFKEIYPWILKKILRWRHRAQVVGACLEQWQVQ